MVKNFYGVNIDFEHPDVVGAKSVDDLKKQEFFAHMPADIQNKVYKELFDDSRPDKKEVKKEDKEN